MDANKEIRVTVSGGPGVGKTAIVEFIARCLNEAGIPAVFDPNSRNIQEDTNLGITTDDMFKRIESIKHSGDRLVILDEVASIDKDALIEMLKTGLQYLPGGNTDPVN